MNRREFVALFGAAAAWPLHSGAQQRGIARVGFLTLAVNVEPYWTLLRQGLRELGYAEGKNIQFELRTAEGANLLLQCAEELVRLKVDVIAAIQTPATAAAKQATQKIPIVMSPAGDPVASGLMQAWLDRAAM